MGRFRDKLREKTTSMGMAQMTPSETRIGQEVANILTTTEYELFAAVDRLVEAADAGDFDVDESLEERRDEILAVADAVAAQRFDDWWWSEVAPDFIANAGEARQYVGLDKAEWRAQIGEWADRYRDAAPERVDGMTDAEIAALHVERRFDASLAEFADEVVEWHAPEHVRGIVEKNLRQSTQTIHAVAAQLEARDLEEDE